MTSESNIANDLLGPRVELAGDAARVHFGAGLGHADFHYRWLRHWCDRERHPLTRERTLDSSDLPDDVFPLAARVAGDALRVRWSPDGHESEYPLSWLDAHAYARDRVAAPPPPSDLSAVELHALGVAEPAVIARALDLVRRHGVAVLRRTDPLQVDPTAETEALAASLEAHALRVIPTHFGRVEDLRTDNTTNANTDQLGYTDAPIQLHTDQPFLEHPPRYQLLQSVRMADEGGANFLVDARAAARYLRDIDRAAFDLLTGTPVTFHRQQKSFERTVISPMLQGVDGGNFLVRYSYFTLAPYRLPFAEMDAWYRAVDRFARLVRDPRHQLQLTLRPGEWVLYDNHRMLHARTGFRGPRWVRGVYFDRA